MNDVGHTTGQQPSRKLYWVLWMILGAALGIQAIRMRIAESAVKNGNGYSASKVRPQNGWGRALYAERLLRERDTRRAMEESLSALRQAPLAVVALRTLAGAREHAYGPRAGQSAWRAAAALGWRDGPTQLWAFRQALLNGEFLVAASRADAFLRTRNRIPQEYLKPVRIAAIDPDIQKALVGRLKLRPPWRVAFFAVGPDASDHELQGVEHVVRGLTTAADVPTRAEAQALIGILLGRKKFSQALNVYRLVSDGKSARGELLEDGSFNRAIEEYRYNSTAFDWWLLPTEGAMLTIDERKGRALLVEIGGDVAASVLMKRYVSLGPGTYRLSYLQGGDPDSPEAISVAISCANGLELGKSSTSPVRGAGYEVRTVTFSVPGGCPLVSLSVAAEPVGRSATAYFDEFSLARLR